MSPIEMETILKYLTDRLAPEEQDELQQLLGKNDGEMPSIASDAAAGRIAFDRLPDRLQRGYIAAKVKLNKSGDAEYNKMFPHAGRLK